MAEEHAGFRRGTAWHNRSHIRYPTNCRETHWIDKTLYD